MRAARAGRSYSATPLVSTSPPASQGAASVDDDDIVDEEIVDEFGSIDPDDYGQIDLGVTAQVVADAVTAIKTVVERHANAVISDLRGLDEDERVLAELIEENLDTDLRQSDEFHGIVDSLVDEIEKRFTTLDVGRGPILRRRHPRAAQPEKEDGRTGNPAV